MESKHRGSFMTAPVEQNTEEKNKEVLVRIRQGIFENMARIRKERMLLAKKSNENNNSSTPSLQSRAGSRLEKSIGTNYTEKDKNNDKDKIQGVNTPVATAAS